MSYTELQDLLDGLDDPDPSADPDASVRLEAVRALEGESAAPAVNALVDRLDDEDEDVAEAAATSLAEILDPIAAPVLLARLDGTQGITRAAILAGLRKLRFPPALTPAIT